MRHTTLSLIFIFTVTALFAGCSAMKIAPAEPGFVSFGIVDPDNRTHVGKIDERFKTVRINTIQSPAEIVDVKWKLTPETSISPTPDILKENCLKSNKFTLKKDGQESEWQVIFSKFGQEQQPEEWVLEWEENFNGDQFDEAIWSRIPKGKSDWCAQMATFEDLVEVKDGILTLWAKKNDHHPEDPRDCLTGGLWTRDQKFFKEGRIVIRARHDQGRGFWPALWLRPHDGPADEYAEIDIVELVKGQAHQTIHTDYTLANKGKPGLGNTVSKSLDDFEGWHEYSVEIHNDRIILGIDGRNTLTYYKRPGMDTGGLQQFPFGDRSFHIILSAQLGGKWAGAPVLDDLPLKFQIDYVRYYSNK